MRWPLNEDRKEFLACILSELLFVWLDGANRNATLLVVSSALSRSTLFLFPTRRSFSSASVLKAAASRT